MVYEPPVVQVRYAKSRIRTYADRLRRTPTPAERRLRAILKRLNGGAIADRFTFQHAVSGSWIVDFFFPEIRLAIEVDGAYHGSEEQQRRDAAKDRDCAKLDITVLRLTNADVFGDRNALVEKLRVGWRAAKRRENRIIGLPR